MRTIPAKEKSNCNTLSKTMVTLLLRQLEHELFNHNLYRTFANYYGNQGLELLKKYYDARALEEYDHHMWIYDYLNEKGISFNYPTITSIDVVINDKLEPFNQTVEVEIETTNFIYEMVKQAQIEEDWITLNWLNKPGLLVDEQLEELTLSNTALDMAKGDGAWIAKSKEIWTHYTAK